MTESPNFPIVLLAEWDWVCKSGGTVIHHLASADDAREFDEECHGGGTTSCGIRSDYWTIPGMFTRMGSKRCSRCCDKLGYPRGIGSPKNDKACRSLVEARIAGHPNG